jgi:hypothetical protein
MPPKKKARATSRPKVKGFRFVDLPPELRDMIYEVTLADANGVSVIARSLIHRTVPCRGQVYAPESYKEYRCRYRRLKVDSKEVAPISTSFVPALLAANKQIHCEAISYLYGHDFIMTDSTALHSSLACIGFRHQQRLSSIEIMGWGRSGEAKGHNYSSMTLLAGATKLKSFKITCDVSVNSKKPGSIAARIYREAHWFLETYGAEPTTPEEWAQSFKVALRNLLGIRRTARSQK